jgi:hypothetical protein
MKLEQKKVAFIQSFKIGSASWLPKIHFIAIGLF